MTIIFVGIAIIAVIAMFGMMAFMTYSMFKGVTEANQKFTLQMEMAKAQSSMTNPLTFEACRTIINQIINFYCLVEDVNRGFYKKTPEEFSLEMEKVIVQIALESRIALSDELIRQFGKFVTVIDEDNYLDKYILNTTKILLMDEIDYRRKNTGSLEPMVMKDAPRNAEKKDQKR